MESMGGPEGMRVIYLNYLLQAIRNLIRLLYKTHKSGMIRTCTILYGVLCINDTKEGLINYILLSEIKINIIKDSSHGKE